MYGGCDFHSKLKRNTTGNHGRNASIGNGGGTFDTRDRAEEAEEGGGGGEDPPLISNSTKTVYCDSPCRRAPFLSHSRVSFQCGSRPTGRSTEITTSKSIRTKMTRRKRSSSLRRRNLICGPFMVRNSLTALFSLSDSQRRRLLTCLYLLANFRILVGLLHRILYLVRYCAAAP